MNREGSYSCSCPKSTRGKLCQFNRTICEGKCVAKGKCYPTEPKPGYECIDDVRTVAMVFRLDDSRLPFEDWMLYDVAKDIENAINYAAIVQTGEGN